MSTTNGNLDLADKQGGKKFGMLKKQQEEELSDINKEYETDDCYSEIEDLPQQLEAYKAQFMEFDLDNSGDIDEMELKQMLEKLGTPKTHKEVKKMIQEVDTNNSGTIHYREFLNMMLGKKSTVLKIILMFEQRSKEKAKPQGLPAKRDISSLP